MYFFLRCMKLLSDRKFSIFCMYNKYIYNKNIYNNIHINCSLNNLEPDYCIRRSHCWTVLGEVICGFLGNYTASCGNYLPTFRDVSVPSSRVKILEPWRWDRHIITRRRVITQKTTDYIHIAAEDWNQCSEWRLSFRKASVRNLFRAEQQKGLM
jgi:hypothetical protein